MLVTRKHLRSGGAVWDSNLRCLRGISDKDILANLYGYVSHIVRER